MSDAEARAREPAGRPADHGRTSFDGGFWGTRVKVNRERTLPSQHTHLVETGRLAGLDPENRPDDPQAHHIFWDSDIAKWLEAACCSLTTHADADLEVRVEEIVARLAKLQGKDGYINSWFGIVEPGMRWTNLRDQHELYCAGHLMEAAVAHSRATGQRHFLDMMCRYADYIDSVFGSDEGKRRGYPGHEEIELALVKLHHATGEMRYLDLARYFIDERGRRPHYFDIEAEARGAETHDWSLGVGYDYNQSHVRVREQDRAVGHSVRAMYLYCGMTDVLRETGDGELAAALDRLWESVCLRQMYITGSVGASSQGERFTADYDLPEETSYCETCAAIGLVFWGQRLVNLHGEGRFADVMELALYNGVMSGISLDGERYFYVNPLASVGNHHREPWFGCACCPSNLARLTAGLGQYAYSDGEAAWVHLYAQGSAELEVQGQKVRLKQRTEYPWDGRVEIEVTPAGDGELGLNLRVPGWCRDPGATLNGDAVDVGEATRDGYLRLARTWKAGDRVVLDLPMPVERMRSHPAVRMTAGKVALQRGPVVYCLEEADNPVVPLARISLSPDAEVVSTHVPELLGGVTVLEGEGEMLDDTGWEGGLYGVGQPSTRAVKIRAVPYCTWDNREPGQMLVWLRETGASP